MLISTNYTFYCEIHLLTTFFLAMEGVEEEKEKGELLNWVVNKRIFEAERFL